MSASEDTHPAHANAVTATTGSSIMEYLDFRKFVYPSILKWWYLLCSALMVFGWLVMIILGFAKGGLASGLLVIFPGVLVLVIYLIVIRVFCELTIVLFRIYDELRARKG